MLDWSPNYPRGLAVAELTAGRIKPGPTRVSRLAKPRGLNQLAFPGNHFSIAPL